MSEHTQFLADLEKKLWTAADKLRSNLDTAVYEYAVPGLVFLKYVSDAFDIRQQEVEVRLRDQDDDCYLDPADYEEAAAAHENANARTSQQPRRTPRVAGLPRIRPHHLYDRTKVLAAGRLT